MCQFSLRNETLSAKQGEDVILDKFSHSRAFKGAHNKPVCIREGCGLTFANASPALQKLAGVNSQNLRATYENPQGMDHNADSNGDGLTFYTTEGMAANFVPFNELPINTPATVAFTDKDEPVWPEVYSNDALQEPALALVRT